MRYDQVVRELRIIAVLLDGKAHDFQSFERIMIDSGVSKKTLRRDLEALQDVPELHVISYRKYDRDFWRCDGKLTRVTGIPLLKKCSYCQKKLELNSDNFHRDSARPDGFKTICVSCELQYNREWRAKNRERYNNRRHSYYLKNRAHIIQQVKNRRARQKMAKTGTNSTKKDWSSID